MCKVRFCACIKRQNYAKIKLVFSTGKHSTRTPSAPTSKKEPSFRFFFDSEKWPTPQQDSQVGSGGEAGADRVAEKVATWYYRGMNYVEVVYDMFYEMIIAFAPCIIPIIVILIVYKIIGKAFR